MIWFERVFLSLMVAAMAYAAYTDDPKDRWCPIGEYDADLGFCDMSDAVYVEPLVSAPAPATVMWIPPPHVLPRAWNACTGVCRRACIEP